MLAGKKTQICKLEKTNPNPTKKTARRRDIGRPPRGTICVLM